MATTRKTNAEPAQKAAKAQAASRSASTQSAAPAKSAAELKAASALEAAAAQARAALQLQMKQWEDAVRMFSQKQFSAANERFVLAAAGPAVHIADKARSYAQICSRKVSSRKSIFIRPTIISITGWNV